MSAALSDRASGGGVVRSCPHCGARNRVPARHLADRGRCGTCKQDLPPLDVPLEVDEALFEEITSQVRVPVLVDFWAAWCGPCRMAAPHVAQAAARLAGKAVVVKVDTERNQAVAARYDVRGIPNFAVFRDGTLRWQHAGLMGTEQLEQAALGGV